MAELYEGMMGSPITYLVSDISAGQTSIAIADNDALPDAPNICTIGYGEQIETIRYGAKNNGVLQQITRGIEGTPRAWQAGTEIARFFTAYDHKAIIENFIAHKADFASLIAGGTLYTPTLQNGWVGSVRYRKNDLGLVELYGVNMDPGIASSTILQLPEGYRPRRHVYSLVYVGNVSPYHVTPAIRLTTGGNLTIREPLLSSITDNSDAKLQFYMLFWAE